MMPVIIQIRRWLMQPKVWRFVGFASSIVGLLCFALSSSFNYLFGKWNLLKILLYSVFSFIICLVILFAKKMQQSRSLRYKAHSAFLVLTITSVYSFFFDKVVNGKPDAYSLISCASFAIMSLSLSTQTHCGFEIDLLYFFLGCLIVQLMKIKSMLFILGAGFSYSLIILRSSFSSIDDRGNGQNSDLQDVNSVVLHMDSLQLASADIASASNNIDSPQPVISTDIGSMMEKLGTCVKALENENPNLIQMLSEHVKKYVEEHSQLVVTDPNLMIDTLRPEIIKDLEETAKVMVTAGFEKEFSNVYSSCRREYLDKGLMQKLFGLRMLSTEDVHNMLWKDLKDEIDRWIKAFNLAIKILFPGERRLCEHVFFGFSSAADFCFMEICKQSTTQLLNFVDSVATGSPSPERLFKMLEVFETFCGLIPEFESLFCDQYSVFLRNEAIMIWNRLGEAIKRIFVELEYLIGGELTNETVLGGGLHPITQYVMNYVRVVCRSRQTLEKVFENSSLSGEMQRIMDTLESNLEAKSKCYEDPSLGYIFLMNNNTYIFQMTKDNEVGILLGDDWFRKHNMKVWHYHEGDVQEIEASPSQQEESRKKVSKTNERTIVIAPAPEFGNTNKMPPEDGFNWRKYEPKKLIRFKYPSRKKVSKTDERTIVISPAPEFGNTKKMPPEDGFNWRKYGEKEFIGFEYPRSYYRCIHRKLYACQATKSVQQLKDIPKVFEVRYLGGHLCRIPLTIPSLILPANVSKDMIQTTRPPLSTSYSKWLSSGTPAEFINSIPIAKGAVPTDGGHHPMMDNVVDYLVSAIGSQQIKVVNEDGTFSLSAQTEGTLELLEGILASKSEKYEDYALRNFFMMNNWRYLELTDKRKELDTIFGNDWIRKIRAKVQQSLELYQRNSWDKVMEFLKLNINEFTEPNVAVNSMKENLSLFYKNYTETCRVQCTWSVHDYKLRQEIIESLRNTLLPAYGIFIGRFQDFLKNDAYEYIRYGMFDIHDILDNLFLGNKKDN